jgi:hypothetical protein
MTTVKLWPRAAAYRARRQACPFLWLQYVGVLPFRPSESGRANRAGSCRSLLARARQARPPWRANSLRKEAFGWSFDQYVYFWRIPRRGIASVPDPDF